MNVQIIVDVMCNTLEKKGCGELVSYLKECESIGSTGGEIFDLLLDRLMNIKLNKPSVFKYIENEAEQIFNYAREQGHL